MNRSADTKPLRLQLSRRSGFDSQKVSRDRNGLPAQSVARPSKWSNPFKVAEHGRERAMALYRAHLTNALATGALDISELLGRNLACWCKLDEACHADILLEQIAHSDD